MFFCPSCNNTFELSPYKINQVGGGNDDKNKAIKSDDILSIISSILEKKEVDMSEKVYPLDDIINSSLFLSLKLEHKELVYNKLLTLNKEYTKVPIKSNKRMYFACKNCMLEEPIKASTIIFSKSYSMNNVTSTIQRDYSDMIYDDTIPITRHYECPNKKCISYTDLNKRAAKFFRMSEKSFKLAYICTACGENF